MHLQSGITRHIITQMAVHKTLKAMYQLDFCVSCYMQYKFVLDSGSFITQYIAHSTADQFLHFILIFFYANGVVLLLFYCLNNAKCKNDMSIHDVFLLFI